MYNHEEVLKYLSSKDKEELALWEGLLANPGWKLLIQKMTEQHGSACAVIANAPSWEAYTYARGARDALEGVLNLETTLEFSVQEKLAEARESALSEAEEDYL